MLEKQKEWCQNKVEKGKAWFEDHMLVIGCAVGSVSTVLLHEDGDNDKERIDKAITAAINRDDGPCEF